MTPLLSSYSLTPGEEGRFAYMMDGERAVVEWRDVRTSKERKMSFQVVMFFGSGDIHFVYRLAGTGEGREHSKSITLVIFQQRSR